MRKNICYALIALALFAANGLFSQILAQENIPDIEDIAAKKHFIWVGSLYSDGQSELLCVQMENRDYALWNPIKDTISKPVDKKCNHVASLTQASATVNRRFSSDKTNFSNGAILSWQNEDSGSCTLNITDSLVLDYNDHTSQSFYLIGRLKKPTIQTTPAHCADDDKVIQKFNTVWGVASVDLKNDKTLIFAADSDVAEPILLMVHKLPSKTWNSNGNTYIVPSEKLSPLLSQTDSYEARYNALLSIIKVTPDNSKL